MAHDIETDLLRRAQRVQQDEAAIGVMSTGERIAVALILDRRDLLDWGTMLESVERLGPDWLRASLRVQRAMR
jgi:hypothetical protein